MAKISFVGRCRVSDAALARHRLYARSLRLPSVEDSGSGPLAVVGGGPSLPRYFDELHAWEGEIWAINGAWNWCDVHGLNATYYRIDPNPLCDLISTAKRAVLADICEPAVFDELAGADARLAKLGGDDIPHGTTAACTAPLLAGHAGYSHVTLYGCESSFGGKTHAYKDEKGQSSLIDVRCGGEIYETSPQMIMQAEWLAEMARLLPGYVTVAGEGFLPALIEHGDYDVIAIPRGMAERIGESHGI